MKKFLLATFVMAALMFCPVAGEAYNYDCGPYPATGLHGYLMTETIRVNNSAVYCTIVCYPSGNPYYIDYTFYYDNGDFCFRNSDGYSSRISYSTPVEQNACDYVLSNYTWHYRW